MSRQREASSHCDAEGVPSIDWTDCPMSAHARLAQSRIISRMACQIGTLPGRVVLADPDVGAVRLVPDRSGACTFTALSMGFHGMWDVRGIYPTRTIVTRPDRAFGVAYAHMSEMWGRKRGLEVLSGPVDLDDLTLLYTVLEAGDYGFLPAPIGMDDLSGDHADLPGTFDDRAAYHVLDEISVLPRGTPPGTPFAEIRPLLVRALRDNPSGHQS